MDDVGRSPAPQGRATHERSQSALSPPAVGVPNADSDPIVGHKTWADGSHTPLRKSEADELWARAEAAEAKRAADMPNEQDAINQLWDAQERLKELGWKDPVYAPKDGSPLDVIELGSTGIHRAYYEGEWPTAGGWWIHDGDVWPCRPALARAASAIEARQRTDREDGLDPKGESAVAEGQTPKPSPGGA
jgi:hypothetical protein